MKKKWHGKKKSSVFNVRKFKKSPKKLGRKTKLGSIDEMLLTMMKLGLAITNKDLSDRFNVSEGVVSSTISTWVKLLSHVLKSLIFIPDQGQLNTTRPRRFNQCKDVTQILDCYELFIETPKDPVLQKSTWSEYKHHNTLKFLITCSPNSSVGFLSDAYPGSISDQRIVAISCFLDKVPMYCSIMADKGFNIQQECLARNITFHVPPGKRGQYQMLPSEVRKTKQVANLRILIEQVICQIRAFKILSHEFPIKLLSSIDDITVICAALVNLKTPIFSD